MTHRLLALMALVLAIVTPAIAHADDDAGALPDDDGGTCVPAPTGSASWPAPSGSASASPVGSAGPASPRCSDDGLCDGKGENDPCQDDNSGVCVLVSCGGGDVLACKVPQDPASGRLIDADDDGSEGQGDGFPGCSIGGAGGAEAASLFTVLGLLLPFASGLRRRRRSEDQRKPENR